MSSIAVESPLVNMERLGQRVLSVAGKSVHLGETAFLDALNIRGKADNAAFTHAVLQCTGLAIPTQANTASVTDQRQLLWLGPDEWLLKLADGSGATIESALRLALQGVFHSVVDVSSALTTLTVQGEGAADLLNCGCPLDLHPRLFPAGSLAQTHIAKTGATLRCVKPGSDYELTVRRSFAQYLFSWLCAAGTP